MEKSPFCLLSPELRNNMYQLALYERRPVAISAHFWTEPALLRSCRQVWEEAKLMFYAVNAFTSILRPRVDCDWTLPRWLQQRSAQELALIKSLKAMIEMPAYSVATQPTTDAASQEWLHLTHGSTDSLRAVAFGEKPLGKVVEIRVNGERDGLMIQDISRIPDAAKRCKTSCASFPMLALAYPEEYKAVCGLEYDRRISELTRKLKESRRTDG